MKKAMIVIVLVILGLAVSANGVAFAQTPQPPVPATHGPMMSGAGVEGPLHDYMVNAISAALGITPADFESRRAAGKTAYQIALELGIAADKIPTLLADARAKALDAAVAAGAITQQQAGWMRSSGMSIGTGLGTCAVTGRGWRWQQANP